MSGLLDVLRSRMPNPEEHEADMVVASYSRIAAAKRAQGAGEGEGREVCRDQPMEVVVKSGGLTKVGTKGAEIHQPHPSMFLSIHTHIKKDKNTHRQEITPGQENTETGVHLSMRPLSVCLSY